MPSATARSSPWNSQRCSRFPRNLIALSLTLSAWISTPAAAQSTANSITFNPNTGNSTLDSLRASKSDTIDLQFPNGFNCKVAGGDVPSLIAYGDQGNSGLGGSGASAKAVSGNSFLANGSRVGMAFVMPLYRSRRANCDKSMKLQNALSELEIAERLVTTGVMSSEEFMKLAERVKKEALGV